MFQIKVDKQVYINTIIVATVNAIGFVIASSLVNKLGKKVLLSKLKQDLHFLWIIILFS